jgi:branched-chain amino acid transport system substrate-binding protein
MPGGRQFVEKYKAKYNKEVELFAPMGYDAVFVLAEAMKRADSVDPAKFLPEVGRTHYNGIIGPIAFDDKGDLKNGPLTVYVVKEGTWDPVETLVSGEVQAAAAESGGKPDVPPTEQKAAGAGK